MAGVLRALAVAAASEHHLHSDSVEIMGAVGLVGGLQNQHFSDLSEAHLGTL